MRKFVAKPLDIAFTSQEPVFSCHFLVSRAGLGPLFVDAPINRTCTLLHVLAARVITLSSGPAHSTQESVSGVRQVQGKWNCAVGSTEQPAKYDGGGRGCLAVKCVLAPGSASLLLEAANPRSLECCRTRAQPPCFLVFGDTSCLKPCIALARDCKDSWPFLSVFLMWCDASTR